MKEQHHVIWSNRDLDYDDWKDDLEAEYPDLSDNERYALMYEINNGYLEDECESGYFPGHPHPADCRLGPVERKIPRIW